MHHTVEKIGGTSMSRFSTVLQHIIIGNRKPEEMYNRIFVVSAYSGITNMLLEHKKNAEPGVFTYYVDNDPKWQDALIKVKGKMLEINKGFKDIGLDLTAANDFVETRINETVLCLTDLRRLCSFGHFSMGEFISAVRELLSSIGEAHSAFNTANILNNNKINATFIDLTGWKDEKKLPVNDVIEKAFSSLDITKTLPIVTGYIKCTEGFVTNFERGYSEIALSKIAAYTKAKEVVIHKEYDLCSADPEVLGVNRVKIIPEINYDMADQLADLGMEAIHPKAAKELVRMNIPIRVKNIFQKNHPGTLIWSGANTNKQPGAEVACGNDKITAIEVWDTEMIGQHGYDYKLVSCFEKFGISYVSKVATTNTITHFVNSTEKNLNECIQAIKETFPYARVDVKDVAIISLTGNLNTTGILAKGAAAIANKGIKVWTSITPMRQVTLQFVVDKKDYVETLSALHESLIENK